MRVLVVFTLALSVTRGQDCRELLAADIGDINAPSSTGLLSSTLIANSGEANPNVQILKVNTVCLGQGDIRDTYRSISLVILYFGAAFNMNITVQAEYQCTAGVWGFGSQPSIITTPQASLTTTPRTDCILCLKPGLGATVSPVEHCKGCDPACDPNGLMRCIRLNDPVCCNFFSLSGRCVETCPPNSIPVNNSDCVCAAGYEEFPLNNTCIAIDECRSNPCQKGGTCENLERDFNCVCALGFTGETCATSIDNCDPNPCENGGSCEDRDLINNFDCDCAPKFTGETCTVPCDAGCVTCLENDTCIRCEDGLTLTEGKCKEDTNSIPIIIGVVVPVVLLLLSIAVIIVITIIAVKKKKKGNSKSLDSKKKSWIRYLDKLTVEH